MKKTIHILLVTLILIMALSSCGSEKISFSYEIKDMKQVYQPGEKFTVVSTINNEGHTITGTGSSSSVFRSGVYIFCGDYSLEVEPFADTCDEVTAKLKNGESKSCEYTFIIPEDAPVGSYSISISYNGESQVFENVFEIKSTDLSDLRERFPEYFNLDAFKGLEVYVWPMAENYFRCGVLSGTNRNKTYDELWGLANNSTSIEQMKTILSSYDIPSEDIVIIAYSQPISSYSCIYDNDYIKNLSDLFDNKYIVITSN